MKKIISLLFATLLSSFLIVSCGSSSDDGDKKVENVNIPGSSAKQSTALASQDTKPEVIPACESGKLVPGCS
jgi:hypothetical protein